MTVTHQVQVFVISDLYRGEKIHSLNQYVLSVHDMNGILLLCEEM